MDESINLNAIYDKNLNLLVGSGASYGLLPTLALPIKDEAGANQTIESLYTGLPDGDVRQTAIFMHYYRECILPAQKLSRISTSGDAAKEKVLENYRILVKTLLHMLLQRRPLDKKYNIFTTNYDPCFSLVADELLQSGPIDFILNDGSRGFTRRLLQARNFNTNVYQTGIFERDQISIPQLNVIHLHGSVHWRKDGNSIFLEYEPVEGLGLLTEERLKSIEEFSAQLSDPNATVDDLHTPQINQEQADSFWSEYRKLPIVNPTKWKFHETVFEEHYYQMLRLLSYELEKPNSVLVSFGFSFADEHILNLIRRSLSNPKLQVYICCFTASEADSLRPNFHAYPNVRFVTLPNAFLTFDAFNSKVFTLGPASAGQQTQSTANESEIKP